MNSEIVLTHALTPSDSITTEKPIVSEPKSVKRGIDSTSFGVVSAPFSDSSKAIDDESPSAKKQRTMDTAPQSEIVEISNVVSEKGGTLQQNVENQTESSANSGESAAATVTPPSTLKSGIYTIYIGFLYVIFFNLFIDILKQKLASVRREIKFSVPAKVPVSGIYHINVVMQVLFIKFDLFL
jgi:hypothetical protein